MRRFPLEGRRVAIAQQHHAGLFWLHPHLQGSVAREVSLGLGAPLVIRGALDAVPDVAAPRDARGLS